MKIVHGLPPNFDKICQAFDLQGMHPIFAWGDTLFVPYDRIPDDSLMAHEETHSRQQAVYGVEKWWDRYLVDPDFRLAMELEAYQNQYAHAKTVIKDRNKLDRYLHMIAGHLASPMYGSIIPLREARRVIVDKSVRFDVPVPADVV